MLPINNLSVDLLTPESAVLWLALSVVALLIDLIAGQVISHRLPSLTTFFRQLAAFIIKKLDRPSRTLSALRIRGFLAIFLLLPIAAFSGFILNSLLLVHLYAPIIALILLLPILGQKRALLDMMETGILLSEKPKGQRADPHQKIRGACARTILNFSTTLVPITIWWCLGGFLLLLPYLLLSAFLEEAEKRRSGHPESPFFASISLLYEITTAPFAILAAVLIALAHFFVPGTNLTVFKAFYPGATFGPVSRYFPLNIIAVGLGLSLEAEIGEKAGSKKASDIKIHWIGPADGRAKFRLTDLKQIWLVIWVTLMLYLIVAAMIFSVLLLTVGAK